MALIKDIANVKLYNKMSDKLDFADLKPYIDIAQQAYIYHYLGKTLTDLLDTYHNANNPTPNTNYNALLPYVQKALIHFALREAKADLNINVTSAGFTTQTSTGFVVASAERAQDFERQQLELAYAATEQLLNYMASKLSVADFASWQKTEGYYIATDNFIRTKSHLQQLTSLPISHTTFNTARAVMLTYQQQMVETIMGAALVTQIKALLNAGTLYDSANSAYLNVYRKACAVIAYASMYDLVMPDDLHRNTHIARAKNYQSILQQHLDSTATSSILPEYYNSGLQNTNTNPLGFTNNADSNTLKLI